MTSKKYFGTDGIRGEVGTSKVNPEFILKLGWAVGKVVKRLGRTTKVVIGKDTRISGYMLESALEAGLSAAGADIYLLGPMPTPAIAYLTRTLCADVGIVISASHNLFADNGIKFFQADGTKFPDEIELAIEQEIDKPLTMVNSKQLGRASRIDDARGRYIEFCKSTLPPLSSLAGLKIVVDCANGATYHIAPNVFSELGAEVVSLATSPNGFNINQDCGSTKTAMLQEKVIATQADIGVALDGDGDRVILVDAKGRIVNGDEILYLLALDRSQQNNLVGGIVGTVMTNYSLEQKFADLKIPFCRTPVGDRYVLEALKKNNWKLGGEPSGHIVCLDKTTTGDGIVAALQILAMLVRSAKSLRELLADFDLYPQILKNINTSFAQDILADTSLKVMTQDLQNTVNGRILLRPSGTEPLLRVMVEGLDKNEIDNCASQICTAINEIKAKF